jgi:hypothetical protein
MIAVADQLKRQVRYAEELLLRQQIVQALDRNLGPQDENALRAELQLGMCIVNLDREEDAEPFLTHVAAESEYSSG